MLFLSEFRFFGGHPADGGGVEEDAGSVHGGEAGTFRVPLIPADENADAADGSVPCAEAAVAGSEVVFFLELGVVGYVHLAVGTEERPVRIDHAAGIEVEPRGGFFEDGEEDDDLEFPGESAETVGEGAGDGFGEFEPFRVEVLAEVEGSEEFLEADDAGSLFGGFGDEGFGAADVVGHAGGAAHLHEAEEVGR